MKGYRRPPAAVGRVPVWGIRYLAWVTATATVTEVEELVAVATTLVPAASFLGNTVDLG